MGNLRARVQSVRDRHARISGGYYVRVGQRVDVLQNDAGHAQVPNGAAHDDLQHMFNWHIGLNCDRLQSG